MIRVLSRSPQGRFALRPVFRVTAFFIVLAFLASCVPPQPADSNAARDQVVVDSLFYGQRASAIPTQAANTDVLSLGQTRVVQGQGACEGAVGSIVPPMAANECVKSGIGWLFRPLDQLYSIASGQKDSENHVYLRGIERFWVHQSKPNDCWAAALQTARDYLRLHPVPQDVLIEGAEKACPRLKTQAEGADVYQVVYSIGIVLGRYDRTVASPHFCDDGQCITASLLNNRPVIMFRSGHAVLVVGADFATDRDPRGGGRATTIISNLKILDPAGNGQIEDGSPKNLCSADAFLAY